MVEVFTVYPEDSVNVTLLVECFLPLASVSGLTHIDRMFLTSSVLALRVYEVCSCVLNSVNILTDPAVLHLLQPLDMFCKCFKLFPFLCKIDQPYK